MENKDKHPLQLVKWGVVPVTNYRGVLVTRLIGGYEVFSRRVRTIKEVDDLISDATKSFQNSITRMDNSQI